MAAPGLSPILKTQPQNSQLEIIFRGPLVKDSQVLNIAELLALDIRYNYKHKSVWVQDLESNYYLVDGDGTQASHWKKHINKLVLELYNELQTYDIGDTVYLAGKIYRAIKNVPINFTPLNSSDYWQMIVGEIVTQRFLFKEQSSIIFYTEISNPLFQVILGELEIDDNDDYVIGDDGMVNIINPVIVDGHVIRRSDLPNNLGKAYELTFEADSQPILLTGAINVK